jgi:RNA exonuclease 1
MTSDYDEPTNGDSQHENHGRKSKKKRKHRDERDSNLGDMISAPELLPQVELPEFSLIAETPQSSNMAGSPRDDAYDNAQEWQTVENGRPTKKAKKLPKPNTDNYPTIKFSSASRLQSQIKISDLQNLVLYILADAAAPQFVSVRHRNQIRKVVVLMVPGLEKSMFIMKSTDDGDGRHKEDADSRREKRLEEKDRGYSYPDDYYPTRLSSETLPEEVKPFSVMFEDLWPVKTPGDDKYGRMHSPFHAMLTAPTPKTKEEKKWQKTGKGASQAKEPIGWQNVRTRVTEFIHSPDELLENDYTLHPASYDDEKEKTALANHRRSTNVSQVDGWVDTLVKAFDEGSVPENEIENGSLTAGRELLAMDCEMCKTGETEFSLTRISIVGWDGAVILDELVKPDKPIIDYLTM